jgi:threonine synthase
VPTGNFGNVFAGWLAQKMGDPIDNLTLATNENDILSRFFNTGEYSLGAVKPTHSPSMDIQVASNFERFLYYRLEQDAAAVRTYMASFKQNGSITPPPAPSTDLHIAAGSGSNAATIATIKEIYDKYNYVLDPHTAVAVKVGRELAAEGPLVCLATAHPAKFPDAITEALGREDLGHHPRVDALSGLPSRSERLPADRETIRNYVVKTLSARQIAGATG